MLMCLSGSLLLRKMRRGCGWTEGVCERPKHRSALELSRKGLFSSNLRASS